MVSKGGNCAQMIDLVAAAGPGCRQTANEVGVLNAECKQDNSSLPARVSRPLSLAFSFLQRGTHQFVCSHC